MSPFIWLEVKNQRKLMGLHFYRLEHSEAHHYEIFLFIIQSPDQFESLAYTAKELQERYLHKLPFSFSISLGLRC